MAKMSHAISCSYQAVVDSYPVLCSRSTTDSSSTAVALGRCLHVVAGSDGEGGEALASVVLADRVDCLTWSGCGRFVLCGLGGGRVQMLHLPTGMPLPAMAVAEEGEDRFFVHCQFESPEQEDGGLGIRMIGRNAKASAASSSQEKLGKLWLKFSRRCTW